MNMRNQKIQVITEAKEWLKEQLQIKEKIPSSAVYAELIHQWILSPKTAKEYLIYFRGPPFIEIAGNFYLNETWQRLEAEREQKEKQKLSNNILDEELKADQILAIKGSIKPTEESANG